MTSTDYSLRFPFRSFLIGTAEYEDGPTGVTLFYFPKSVRAALDIRGGAVSSCNTDVFHRPCEATITALCFAGGSSYGLETAAGVRAELLAAGRADPKAGDIPRVVSSVVFDFGGRDNTIYPDQALARLALRSAKRGVFPLGARGAGRFVHVGKLFGSRYRESSGQGGAFVQVGSTKIAVFTVVNAMGAIMSRTGSVLCGNLDPDTGIRTSIIADIEDGTAEEKRRKAKGKGAGRSKSLETNTTLTLVVTNEDLSYVALNRLAVQTHTSMGRAIQPFHTVSDGDALFAVTTSEVRNTKLDPADLPVYCSELAWDAILNCTGGSLTRQSSIGKR